MVQRQRFRLAVALCTAALASACFSGGGDQQAGEASSGPQAEQQVEAGVPEEYRAKAAADGRNRLIDACGLHDPKAAAEVTGDQGDEILPSTSGLQECILRLHQADKPDKQTWTFYLETGAMYDASSRKNDAPEKLGGMDVFISEDEKRCEISKPIDDTYAIQLRASASSDTPAKPACQVLREYVTKLAPVWQEMPKHGSGRTKPELTLVKLDPCTAASATLDMFEEGFLETSGPMTCAAKPAKPSPAPRERGVGRNEVAVTWVMSSDPSKLVRPGDQTAREVTVEGRKTVMSKGSFGCTTYIVWDETTVDPDNRSEDDNLSQQIRVQTAKCDNAEEVAKKILSKVAKR